MGKMTYVIAFIVYLAATYLCGLLGLWGALPLVIVGIVVGNRTARLRPFASLRTPAFGYCAGAAFAAASLLLCLPISPFPWGYCVLTFIILLAGYLLGFLIGDFCSATAKDEWDYLLEEAADGIDLESEAIFRTSVDSLREYEVEIYDAWQPERRMGLVTVRVYTEDIYIRIAQGLKSSSGYYSDIRDFPVGQLRAVLSSSRG